MKLKKLKKDNPTNRVLSCFTGGAICLVFLLVLYAVKGFFPFGDKSIAIMDMCHGYLPMYYHLYDFLHGSKSLFFDFYSGTGVNMVGIAAVNGLLSPLNLLFYLTSREGLVNFINIFFIIKIIAAAVSAQVCLQKRFDRLPTAYAAAFAVIYALSGYVMLYYMHIIWLDVLILFPLLCFFCEKMLRGGRVLPYAICLALTLLCSFYLGVMTLMAVFFISGAYVLVLLKKEERPRAAVRLGVGTAVGGLLPMFLILPGYMQMSSSARYGFSDGFFELLGAQPELNLYKILMFFGLQLPMVFVIRQLCGYKSHPLKTRFAGICLLVMFAPLALEGSAALWHFGSYKDFPYRFGFAAVFTVLLLAAEQIHAAGDRVSEPVGDKNMRLANMLIALSAIIAFGAALRRAFAAFGKTLGSLSAETTALLFSVIVFAVGALMFFLLLRVENQKIRRIAALALCVAQLFPFAVMSIGSGSAVRYERAEHDAEYIEPSLQIGKLLTTDNAQLERVHNPDMSLNINYGFVAGKAALSNWTHQIPAALQSSMKALGYSTTYTLLLDGGGTVFSDALLQMKQTVSKQPMNDALYASVGEYDGYRIYDNRYTLPIGIVTDAGLLTADLQTPNNGKAVFENQNLLYRVLGGKGTLIRTDDADETMVVSREQGENTVTYRLLAAENEVLYFTSPSSAWKSMEITVNGKAASVPSYHKEDNTDYTAEYNNNCLELGVFNRETVTVCIKLQGNGANQQDFAFGFLSLEKMTALAEKHSGDGVELQAEKNRIAVHCSRESEEPCYLLLPIAYDGGWQCRADGEDCKVYCVAGSLTAVELPAGAREAELVFRPTGSRAGLLLSGLGLVALGGLIFAELKAKKITLSAVGDRAVYGLFAGLWFAAVFVMYILPLAYMVVGVFQ